jgi:hypothetical protein
MIDSVCQKRRGTTGSPRKLNPLFVVVFSPLTETTIKRKGEFTESVERRLGRR